MKVIAKLRASLMVECPRCKSYFDLFANDDDDYNFLGPIFNGRWELLHDEDVECPECDEVFTIQEVER